jgi:3-deoxy-D-manno-octulosonate 8-phosphate phosphatase (KDO 8-P phosphatase)
MGDKEIRLVAVDVDGTLTDGAMIYDYSGNVSKRFYVRDGLGVKLLQAAGLDVAWVTSDAATATIKRAERLGVRHCLAGVTDKVSAVQGLCEEIGISLGETAFLGDDLQDLDVMQAVGLPAAVGDAHRMIKSVAVFHCVSGGGFGAFREFAEHLLAARGEDLKSLMSRL